MQIDPFLFLPATSQAKYHHHITNRFLYISNVTGLPQAYEYNGENGRSHRRTYTNERIMFISYIPGHSNTAIMGMDEGVNERQQLFLLNEAGDMTPLTNSSGHIHVYGGCSPDGKWVAWSSNRRDLRNFDVYIQNLESLEFTCVYESDGRYDPVLWHPDGDQLLIKKTNTNLDNDLGLINIRTKEVTWLTSHEGEAFFHNPHFSKDLKKLYVLTNYEREYASLLMINLETSEWSWMLEYSWDMEELTINHSKTKVAYTINEGGCSKAFLYSLLDGSQVQIPTKQGVISGFSFSADDAFLAFELNGATHPTDLWSYCIQSNESKRLTYSSYSPMLDDVLIEPEQHSFESFDGTQIPYFFYKPKQKGPHPAIVFVHGGPESQIRSVYNPFLQYFIHQGYAVCTPNVRGSTGYGKAFSHLDDKRKRMDAVRDLDELARWLKGNHDVHPDKLAIMGRSYGGFMVLAAITHFPEQWAAAIDIVGISSFKSFLENTSIWRRKMREAEYGSLEEDLEFFNDIDPVHRTDAITAPLLVLHGRNDPRVPVSEAEQLVADLEKRDHPVSYLCFEDEGHFFVRTENNRTAYTETATFLTKWLHAKQ